MKNMKHLIWAIALLAIVSCDDASKQAIFTEDSTRIVLSCGDSYSPAPADKDVEYDFKRSELSNNSLSILKKLAEVEDDLSCMNDGQACSLKVFNSAGDEKFYKSDNTDCGGERPDGYLSLETLKELHETLQ
ncbi:MAG: hypothetical protein JXR76_28070 [Deltaproteobacteria bacterium]|nr:hypothetical protein [Deltaproteobacteria bacterium]